VGRPPPMSDQVGLITVELLPESSSIQRAFPDVTDSPQARGVWPLQESAAVGVDPAWWRR